MFSDQSSFEMYNSVVMDCMRSGDRITLKCLYMQVEFAYITFEKVTDCQNYGYLKGNTISYIKACENGYEIYFINETIAPTIIKAASHNIEWR